MTSPTLPQTDPDPERRARRLAEARQDYVFDWSYQGIAAVRSLPLRDRSDARWWAAVTERILEVQRNALRGKVTAAASELAHAVEHRVFDALPGLLRGVRPPAGEGDPGGDPLAPWRSLFRTLPAPAGAAAYGSDAAFGWWFVAGANPVVLRRADGAPPGLDAARALGEGRLYCADYALFAGLPAGVVEGRTKVVAAPTGWFEWDPTRRALLPVAIRADAGDARVWTPRDGTSWTMAKTALAAADGNHQGIVSHFAVCHQVMESVIVSARRQLAEAHPLRILLEPHFRDTLITNDIAMGSLVNPGGHMDRLQAPTLEASLGVARAAIDAFRLTASSPAEEFGARGVLDPAGLGVYPARDDAMGLWAAVERWVQGYVGLYYTSDADVVADPELAAFAAELGAEDGGRLRGIGVPATRADAAGLVARIVYRCTGWHAQFNYTSWDWFAFAPAMPTAQFGPGPGGVDDEAAWLAMLPPTDLAAETLGLFWQLRVQLSALGAYPEGTFADPRVAPLLDAHQAQLRDVEAATAARDATRPWSWPFLRPSQVPLSIHV